MQYIGEHSLFGLVTERQCTIGEKGGVNLYGMVGNDAVNRWDLLGRCAECGFGGVDLKVPKTGPGNTSIGSRITFLYLMRMLVGDGYARYGRLQSPDDLYTIADRKKEMEKDLGEEFDSFYLAYGSKLQREGKLTSNWQKIRVKNEKVTEYLGGGIIWPSTGKLSAGWWLSSANDISASGSLEYRCRSGIIQYRNRSIVWRWNDRIDCNDYNTLREEKGAGIPGSILEGIIVNSLESLINASFKVIVIGKDERKVSGT